MRSIKSVVPERMDNTDKDAVTEITRSGFNNDWKIRSKKPLPDQKLNISYNRRIQAGNGREFAVLSALNYNLSSKTITDMENSRFGLYNVTQDTPEYSYKYTDHVYNTNAHLGAMLNLTFRPNNRDKYELKNIFNQIGQDRYTARSGYQYISGMYVQEKYEYYYNSRTTYSGQLAGTYNREQSKFDWEAGYNYANRR